VRRNGSKIVAISLAHYYHTKTNDGRLNKIIA